MTINYYLETVHGFQHMWVLFDAQLADASHICICNYPHVKTNVLALKGSQPQYHEPKKNFDFRS